MSSLNYQAKKSQGWTDGNAKYASQEPHHGPGGYSTMHNPLREKLLTLILEGEWADGPDTEKATPGLIAAITLRERFPQRTNSAEEDYEAAARNDEVRPFLVRQMDGFDDEIALQNGRENYTIDVDGCGWSFVVARHGEWIADYYDAKLVRD